MKLNYKKLLKYALILAVVYFLLQYLFNNIDSFEPLKKLKQAIANKKNNLTPPAYFTSCDGATSYGCQTCINAVVRDAPQTKCGWVDTGRLTNGNQHLYTCQSGGSQKCPTF